MKKSTLIVNIAIAIAVVVLYVLYFVQKPACQGNGNVQVDSLKTSLTSEFSAAWVDMDTVLNRYDMYFDYLAQLEQKSKDLEAELNTKSKKFEKEAMDFQDKVQKGLLTRSEAQQQQAVLANKEQELYGLRDEMRMKIAEEQQVKLRQIHHSISEYLKRYNVDKGYYLIFSHSFGGQLLYGHPAINITTEVLNGLNAEYAQSKK